MSKFLGDSAEVVTVPTEIDAEKIAGDYHEAMAGSRAWVRMGLRLLNVKQRLKHGEFMPWCDDHFSEKKKVGGHRQMRNSVSHLPKASMRHLQSAMRVASTLLNNNGYDLGCAGWVADEMEESPFFPELSDDGKSIRQLTFETNELRNDVKEDEAKKYCLEIWKKSPESRDEWEPKVLSGELTYVKARMGMLGQKTTKGKNRAETQNLLLLEKNVSGLTRNWKAWGDADSARKERLLSQFCQTFDQAPDEIRTALANHLSNTTPTNG